MCPRAPRKHRIVVPCTPESAESTDAMPPPGEDDASIDACYGRIRIIDSEQILYALRREFAGTQEQEVGRLKPNLSCTHYRMLVHVEEEGG